MHKSKNCYHLFYLKIKVNLALNNNSHVHPPLRGFECWIPTHSISWCKKKQNFLNLKH